MGIYTFVNIISGIFRSCKFYGKICFLKIFYCQFNFVFYIYFQDYILLYEFPVQDPF